MGNENGHKGNGDGEWAKGMGNKEWTKLTKGND